MRRLHPLIGKGLAAAVYTQTTDVEVEVNGLMTYDREVIKFDVAETAKWHKALFGPPPEFRDARRRRREKAAQKWRYTTDEAGRRLGEARLRRREVERGRRRLRHEGHAGHGRPHRVEDAGHLAPPDVRADGRCRPASCACASTTTRTPRSTSTACWPRRSTGYTTDYVEVPLIGREAARR